MSQKLVALTGISGYIAGSVAQLLLNKGYHVNGTVRSLKNKKKVSHLMSLAETSEAKKAGGKLVLFEADLEKEGSFKDAFKGVVCVFHTASPFFFEGVTNGEDQVIKPAIKGTENVLNEAFKAKTVQRIVLTSSMAAVGFQWEKDFLITEKCWNNCSKEEFYSYSKTWAEKRAWSMIEEFQKKGSKMDLVAINPTLVIGPPTSDRDDSVSLNSVKVLIDGSLKEDAEDTCTFIDVRDVAKAHLAAWENKKACGRYFLTPAEQIYYSEAVDILKKNYSKEFEIVTVKGEKPQKRKWEITKTIELIGKLTPLETSLKDTVEALVKFGLVKKKK